MLPVLLLLFIGQVVYNVAYGMICGGQFPVLRDVTLTGTWTSTLWNQWMTFYTGSSGRKYHVLPLASLLVKRLTNNGIFFPPEASALTVHFSHFYHRPLFRIPEKRVGVFLNSRQTCIWVPFFIFFFLAGLPASWRPSAWTQQAVIKWWVLGTHNQNTVRWHGLPSLWQ